MTPLLEWLLQRLHGAARKETQSLHWCPQLTREPSTSQRHCLRQKIRCAPSIHGRLNTTYKLTGRLVTSLLAKFLPTDKGEMWKCCLSSGTAYFVLNLFRRFSEIETDKKPAQVTASSHIPVQMSRLEELSMSRVACTPHLRLDSQPHPCDYCDQPL
jgi:hypothetical protein